MAVVLLVQAFLVKPYRIPSESMAATLVPSDRVLVDRLGYRWQEPRRGDVIVADSAAAKCVLIKRVIALPGETVSIAHGSVFIDGRRLREPYVRMVTGKPEPTVPFEIARPWSLQHPYVVPADYFFLMGDNRTVSADSREWGPVPRGEIIGEAFATYWPLTRARGL